MQISVVGLGVEGQKATISLLKRGFNVYSSDINRNIKLDVLNEYLDDSEENLDLEIGSHNTDKIFKSDAVAVSPSLFKKQICQTIIEKNIFISDVLNKHKKIKTIAVTGTNGKTTTSHMIYHILKNENYNVLLGGNGGGGFEGYIDLLLQANQNNTYDYLIIEVCDMTLEFCQYVFDIDMIVVTNVGYDHMDVHGSIEHYTEELGEFIKNKTCILNYNDENLRKIKNKSNNALFFKTYEYPLNLFGEFNLQNADAARVTCSQLGIKNENIVKSLETFKSVEGRTLKLKYNDLNIVAGKTDNVDALKAVLDEEQFNILIIGTARKGETFRLHILDYINKYKPNTLILFPGLEDTTYDYMKYLNKLGYNQDTLIIKEVEDLINYINNQKNVNIFIGGNGQSKITDIINILSH
ncbi:MAG: UDP-N-acetylmuramoyl-L-alanine--D-glutamate ligase [Methanosphaera stadtmanae]|nr:UDP-N-acetylmuramoyl-L-alanine--D-glutamate ligase [Methanosphaera stadtmanae]